MNQSLASHPDSEDSSSATAPADCSQPCSVDSRRRDFLVRAAVGMGSVALGLSGITTAQAQDEPAPATGDLVLTLDGDSPLKEVGGFQTLNTQVGKVVVARTGEASFAACSAVCPHKGGPIEYDAATQQFFCPWHNSRFDLTGKVVRPPARQPLQSYAPHSAVVVSLKPAG